MQKLPELLIRAPVYSSGLPTLQSIPKLDTRSSSFYSELAQPYLLECWVQ